LIWFVSFIKRRGGIFQTVDASFSFTAGYAACGAA